MRLIILMQLIVNVSIFSQTIECEDDYYKISYAYNQFKITECDCKGTLQENTFFICNSDQNSMIKLSGASSKIIVNGNYIRNNHPMMGYYKYCTDNAVPEKNALNFYSVKPYGDGYCYEYSAYIDSTGNLQVLKDYVSVQLFETIVPEKQFLYNENNKCTQTKMYLIKGDKVEVLKEEGEWLYILYNGTKEIRKWIPKCAVE